MVKNNQLKSITHKFAYKSNDFIFASDYLEKCLILATKKYLKIYRYKNKKLYEKEKILLIGKQVTCLKLLPNLGKNEGNTITFLASFTDGSILKYSQKYEKINYEISDNFDETVVKKISKTEVVHKILLQPVAEKITTSSSSVIFTTFSNKIFKISGLLKSEENSKSKPEILELISNDNPIEYLNFSKNYPNCLVVASNDQIFLLNFDNNKIEKSEKNFDRQNIVYYDFHDPELEKIKNSNTLDGDDDNNNNDHGDSESYDVSKSKFKVTNDLIYHHKKPYWGRFDK